MQRHDGNTHHPIGVGLPRCGREAARADHREVTPAPTLTHFLGSRGYLSQLRTDLGCFAFLLGADDAERLFGGNRRDLIAELEQQYTIVIVTQNMQQAARVSQDVAFFNLAGVGQPGQLVEFRPTDHMFSSPSDQRTEDYISGRLG